MLNQVRKFATSRGLEQPGLLKLLGIQLDSKSSYLQGSAIAPDRIRQCLHGGSSSYYTESDLNPIDHEQFHDIGNLEFDGYLDIKKQMAKVLADGSKSLTLGGDHSITYPIIQAYKEAFGEFEILHIDAHGDLYDEFEGDKHSHACPFARIMEDGLVSNLTQVGVRVYNPEQRELVERHGIKVVKARDFEAQWKSISFDKPVYISLDLDGLDPAYAPGVSHHEPGGLTTRQVLDLIASIQTPVIGADIVEYNPHRDHSDMTAAVAAKFLKEIAGKIIFGK